MAVMLFVPKEKKCNVFHLMRQGVSLIIIRSVYTLSIISVESCMQDYEIFQTVNMGSPSVITLVCTFAGLFLEELWVFYV